MAYDSLLDETPPGAPEPPPPDDENPALEDALQTFKITVIGAILFGLASLAIILRTRMGG